jgi:hypothetical protein
MCEIQIEMEIDSEINKERKYAGETGILRDR